MPKWKRIFGNLQSPFARAARLFVLSLALALLIGCGGPGSAAPTPLPPGDRVEQPTPVFLAPTQTPTSESSPTDEDNPVQALLATQIALRLQETPTLTATLMPTVVENGTRSIVIDRTLSRPTSMGIAADGAAFFASPGGAVIQSLPAGETLTITGRSGNSGWYAAYLGDGRAGWVAVGSVRIFGDPGELEIVSESISPGIVATLIAEANRPVTPIPTTAPATRAPAAPAAETPTAPAAPPQSAAPQPTPTAERPTGPQATVIVDGLNVRAGPGTEFDIVGSLVLGNTATMRGRNEAADWIQIDTPQGLGWIFAPLVETSVPIADLPVVAGN
jgi:uncharacterized protein YraI